MDPSKIYIWNLHEDDHTNFFDKSFIYYQFLVYFIIRLFDQDGDFSNPSMRYIVQISSYRQN